MLLPSSVDRSNRRPFLGQTSGAFRGTELGVALVACLSALALGGADVRVVLVGTLALVGCGVLGMLDGSFRRISAPALIMAGLGVYSLLQAVPLPLACLRFMSPVAAEAWSRSLMPFGEQVGLGSLSLDPGASCVEGAKWLAYAVAV